MAIEEKNSIHDDVSEEIEIINSFLYYSEVITYRSPNTVPNENNYASFFWKTIKIGRPNNWQVHHTLPQQLRECYQEQGINIDDVQYLRGVHPNIHQDISNIQRSYLKNLERDIREEIAAEKGISPTEVPKKVVYKEMSNHIDDLNNLINERYGSYMISKDTWSPQKVVRISNTFVTSNKRHIYLSETLGKIGGRIKGTGVILFWVEGLQIMREISAPSPQTEVAFQQMMQWYRVCLESKEKKGYISPQNWDSLTDKVIGYLSAIQVDSKFRNYILRQLSLVRSNL